MGTLAELSFFLISDASFTATDDFGYRYFIIKWGISMAIRLDMPCIIILIKDLILYPPLVQFLMQLAQTYFHQ